MAQSKHFSSRPPEAIMEELGSVKDLLSRFDDDIEDILSKRPQPELDIPLLSDIVPAPDDGGAARDLTGPLTEQTIMQAPEQATTPDGAPAARPPSAPLDGAVAETGDARVAQPGQAPSGSLPVLDLNSADIEELEHLVFSDAGPSLPGASPVCAAPLPPGGEPLNSLQLLPHLVDDVIDAYIPRLKAELLTRLRALIEHADEQRRQV